MLLLGRKTAEEKVASFLLDMARHLAHPGFDLPVTRAQMADVLGLTIETVSRQMTKLKRDGLIDLSSGRMVLIRDLAVLQGRSEAS